MNEIFFLIKNLKIKKKEKRKAHYNPSIFSLVNIKLATILFQIPKTKNLL